MSTSGSTTFNLDLNNLIEEAFERCGTELRTGYDMRTARRSLNLLNSLKASDLRSYIHGSKAIVEEL